MGRFYWFRGCKGLQLSKSMSFFREGWPPPSPRLPVAKFLMMLWLVDDVGRDPSIGRLS